MKSFSIPSAEGITIEFWLRQKKNNEPLPLLVIKSDNQLLYKIQEGAGFFNYYHYTHHQKGELTLSYDEDRAEIPFFITMIKLTSIIKALFTLLIMAPVCNATQNQS